MAAGTEDVIGGPAEELAGLIPGAEHLPIPRRDHMLAVGDKAFKAGVLDVPGTASVTAFDDVRVHLSEPLCEKGANRESAESVTTRC